MPDKVFIEIQRGFEVIGRRRGKPRAYGPRHEGRRNQPTTEAMQGSDDHGRAFSRAGLLGGLRATE